MRSLKRFLSTLPLLLLALSASAQVSMELFLNRGTYMQNEPVFAKVKMRNYSGQPLVFGKDSKLQGELLFEFVGPDKQVLPLAADDFVPMLGTILRPGETKEFVVPLSKYFKFSRVGTYRGHAYVRHKMLKDMFKSNDVRLDVARGVEVWRRAAGMPDVLRSSDSKNRIEERVYILKTMTEGNVKHYYLQIEDNKHIYAIFRIGREVGMERFKADVDMLSRLHLLLPISPKIFRYNIINLNGQVELDRYMKSTSSIPSLVRDPGNGRIHVVGGAEALPGIDYQAQQKGHDRATDSSVDSRR